MTDKPIYLSRNNFNIAWVINKATSALDLHITVNLLKFTYSDLYFSLDI